MENYEQKYKESLKAVKELSDSLDESYLTEELEKIFPELKESEGERIRKYLLKLADRCPEDSIDFMGEVKKEDVVAWLEKQGDKDNQVTLPPFTFDDILALQCCMETVKKVQEDKDLYEKLKCLHGRVYDAYQVEKRRDKCLVNFDEAEKEKYDFVSGQYIQCRASFNEFKEDNSYWFEYIGNDTYIGRSDNILNQKFHITPRQLYRLFTQEHFYKENNVNEETNAPTAYGKYVDECLNDAAKHFYSEGEDKYSVADLFYAGVRCGKSWLEKQGKQEEPQVYETEDGEVITYSETDGYKVVEPKFNVGDWVVASFGNVNQVIAVDEDGDGFTLDDGTYFSGSWKDGYHLWTIQDAKDGDVLKEDSCTFIVKRMKNDGTAIIHCCLFDDGDFDSGSTLCFDVDSTYPATQEQRNLLFQKMKEAGYEWDAEKKELKKVEQKPAWSEEDERMCNASIRACQYMVEHFENSTQDYEDAIDWLKSLKDRVQSQLKPSEEQLKALNTISVTGCITEVGQGKFLVELYEQLKKLKEG